MEKSKKVQCLFPTSGSEINRPKIGLLRPVAKKLFTLIEDLYDATLDGVCTEVNQNLKKGSPRDKFCYTKFGAGSMEADYQAEVAQYKRLAEVAAAELPETLVAGSATPQAEPCHVQTAETCDYGESAFMTKEEKETRAQYNQPST